VDWIFSIRLTADMNIAGRRNGKDGRITAKRLRSFDFGFALFEAFDTPVSAASQNTNQFSKSSQSILNFQPCGVSIKKEIFVEQLICTM
jgi:hypothetical protein